jgi:hypothetical protein
LNQLEKFGIYVQPEVPVKPFNILPQPSIHQRHGHRLQGELMSLRVLQHFVRHKKTTHHEEDLDYHASVEEQSLEELVVGL